MSDFMEMMRKAEETSNVGERLLAKGETIVYRVNGDPKKPLVRHYPDGRIFVLKYDENGKSYEAEPYHE